jgi:hypothetical protein
MNTHTPMMRAERPAASVRGRHAKGGPRTESPAGNVIRVSVTTLLLAALAASSAALAGHVDGHALLTSGYILRTPWMY